MKTYTEEQVKQIIKYTCEYQQAQDYQLAARILWGDESKDLSPDGVKVLDVLSSETNLVMDEIELTDIFKS